MVRLSVGLEDPADVLADLDQALTAAHDPDPGPAGAGDGETAADD
jgi:hypothetical protein